jgi:hypothetical protein
MKILQNVNIEFNAEWYVNRQDSQAYIWHVDGKLRQVIDLPDSPDHADVHTGIKELLAARAMLTLYSKTERRKLLRLS